MFLILKGQIAGFLPDNDGRIPEFGTVPSFFLKPGNITGELAFALNRKQSATLYCTEDTSLLAFDYPGLIRFQSDAATQKKVENLILETVRARVLDNLCKSCPFLVGPNHTGPLKEFDRVTLNKYSRLWSRTWSEKTLSFDTLPWEKCGLHFLVSGSVEVSDTGKNLDGASFPLLYADLEPDIRFKRQIYKIRQDIRVLSIDARGFKALGGKVYEKMIQQVRDFLGPAAQEQNMQTPSVSTRSKLPAPLDGILQCYACHDSAPVGNVVFVHGLDGDAVLSWQAKANKDAWPKWLGEDLGGIGVWAISYDASSSGWRGHSMPVFDRAANVLAKLEASRLLNWPLVFVCHSLGGLLVKEMLRVGRDSGNANWTAINTHTKGIAFLSTPHSGSDVANWVKKFGALLRPPKASTNSNTTTPASAN